MEMGLRGWSILRSRDGGVTLGLDPVLTCPVKSRPLAFDPNVSCFGSALDGTGRRYPVTMRMSTPSLRMN